MTRRFTITRSPIYRYRTVTIGRRVPLDTTYLPPYYGYMDNDTNPQGIMVNDEVTKGTTGNVIYGVVKIVGTDALCIKVYGTRAKVRRVERIPLTDLFHA